MPRDNLRLFTPADIRLIREQAASGTLSTREWALARGCGVETIRRIARRETYGHISDAPEPLAAGDEPLPEELAASLARLSAAAQTLPPQRQEIHDILDDLTRKGGPV
ncbi:MAG TPA: hypothetical protein PKV98_07815 [Burkholderiaceae bacterium]|nr:hypothetical protein [Burkholderiaceae bacterium]